MAYGRQLDYNVSQTGCHVKAIYTDLLVPGNFIIKKYGLPSVCGVFEGFWLHPRLSLSARILIKFHQIIR